MIKTYLPTTSATQTVDATGQSLGRVASHVAAILHGKDKPTFSPHRVEGDLVVVTNAASVRYTGRKLDQKMYYKHTAGYIGNLKEWTLKQLLEKDVTEPLRRAIYGMLPDNRLRKELMKRLVIHPGLPEEK